MKRVTSVAGLIVGVQVVCIIEAKVARVAGVTPEGQLRVTLATGEEALVDPGKVPTYLDPSDTLTALWLKSHEPKAAPEVKEERPRDANGRFIPLKEEPTEVVKPELVLAPRGAS